MLSFPRETNHCPVTCHPYKAGCHCTHCVPSFLALAFSSSIAFTIYCSIADTTIHTPAPLVASSANADDSGHDFPLLSLLCRPTPMTWGTTLGWKAPQWQPLLLQLTTPQKMVGGGGIPKLTDFFNKTTVTEDNR
jgi:hypothetical protein